MATRGVHRADRLTEGAVVHEQSNSAAAKLESTQVFTVFSFRILSPSQGTPYRQTLRAMANAKQISMRMTPVSIALSRVCPENVSFFSSVAFRHASATTCSRGHLDHHAK
jgi:hypothetical protein